MKWKGVTWSHIGHTVQTGILYCSNAGNQFIFFIKIIYTECTVSSVPSNFIHIYFLLKRKMIKWCKKKIKLLIKHKRKNKWVFSLCKAMTEANLLKKMPPTQQGIDPSKTKQKQLQNPFSIIRSHFTAIKLLGYNSHTWTVKDGQKGLRYQIKPYSETKALPKRGKGKYHEVQHQCSV